MSYMTMYHERDIDKPVEQLFTSIFQLQILDEYDSITNLLKKELENFFEQVVEKDGKKKIRSLHYYPNGLCEWQNKTEKIILSPWKNKTDVKNQIKRDYTIIKNTNIIWYLQFMDYMKKPIRVKNEKVEIREIVDFTKKYETLSEEEKKLFMDERAHYHQGRMERELLKLRELFFMGDGYYSRHEQKMEYDRETDQLRIDFKKFRLLNEEQLEDLKAIFESSLDRWQFERKVRTTLYEYIKLFYGEDESMKAIDFSDLVIDTKNRVEVVKNRYGNRENVKLKYTFDFENSSDAAMALLNRFSEVDDDKLKKLFKKLGM